MKIRNLILFAILIMVFGSCAVEDPTTVETTADAKIVEPISRTGETLEMKEFREALVAMARSNAAAKLDGKTASLFDQKNSEMIAANAKALLLASGHSKEELKAWTIECCL